MPEILKQTQVFRFDQMAVQVKDKVEPSEADVDRYVGLEHIDPESLKIRRWGETSDVESSKIIFKSGDIIFGKRRAYQRKLAVADFDGICSAHAMVLRPKTEVVLEEFLPFFMQSDIFMDRAVKISVGGLSPTINWKDLAKEEFSLPPIEEQRRISEVLKKAQQTSDAYYLAAENLLMVRRSMQSRLLFPENKRGENAQCRIDDIVQINPTDPPLGKEAPFFPMAAIDEWARDISVCTPEQRGTRGGVRACAGDVLMARITPCLENGKIAQVPMEIERCGGSTEFIVFRAKKGVSKSFIYWLITSDRIRNVAIAMMCGSTGRQRVSGPDLMGLLIPKIDQQEMARLGSLIDDLEHHRKRLLEKSNEVSALQNRLLNRLMGDRP